ncbi:hypothetical protein HLB03_03885, partial [Acidianus sp. DSM 29099]|nr:hypothetical protein [Acidianus sp. RZ1]
MDWKKAGAINLSQVSLAVAMLIFASPDYINPGLDLAMVISIFIPGLLLLIRINENIAKK